MLPTLSPQEFVEKWRKATLKERSAAQEHFIDLCHLVGHSTPAGADPTGETFTFEAGATKQRGGQGWSDVRPHFILARSNDVQWYRFLVDQFEKLWKDGQPHEIRQEKAVHHSEANTSNAQSHDRGQNE